MVAAIVVSVAIVIVLTSNFDVCEVPLVDCLHSSGWLSTVVLPFKVAQMAQWKLRSSMTLQFLISHKQIVCMRKGRNAELHPGQTSMNPQADLTGEFQSLVSPFLEDW